MSLITSDPIYTFQLNSDKQLVAKYAKLYKIEFIDWDGTVLYSENVRSGESQTQPQNPTRNGYTFIGWDKKFDYVITDLTINAIYSISEDLTDTYELDNDKQLVAKFTKLYEVKFIDWDETVLSIQTVKHGNQQTQPQNPTREGYIFVGWDKKFDYVTSDLTINAIYSISEDLTNTYELNNNKQLVAKFAQLHKVTFIDWDGTILDIQMVSNGKSQTQPPDPVKEGYTFIGWDKTFDNITFDTTISALYDEVNNISYAFTLTEDKTLTAKYVKYITVTFKDWDGTIIDVQMVNEGESQIQPPDPVREGHIFIGWDKEFNNITSELVVTALYEVLSFTITGRTYYETINGKVWDTIGSINGLGIYDYGDSVTIEQEPHIGYHFANWQYSDNQTEFQFLSNQNPYTFTVTKDLQVFAEYEINKYFVTFGVEGNGSIDRSSEYINHGELLRTINYFPDPGWKFSTWKVNGVETDVLPTIVIEDLNIIQVFEKEIYQLTININGNGTTDIISGQYEYGDVVEITQTPDNHWEFKNWTGDIVSNNNPLSLTINKDMMITQNFVIKQYNFTYEIIGNGRINIQQGKYPALTTLNITQIPDISSIFKTYTGQLVSENETIELLMDSDKHLVVVFELKKFTITYEIIGNGTATLIPNQEEFEYGSNQKIQITPEQGWVVTKIEER